jgi:hypothetical protein
VFLQPIYLTTDIDSLVSALYKRLLNNNVSVFSCLAARFIDENGTGNLACTLYLTLLCYFYMLDHELQF